MSRQNTTNRNAMSDQAIATMQQDAAEVHAATQQARGTPGLPAG